MKSPNVNILVAVYPSGPTVTVAAGKADTGVTDKHSGDVQSARLPAHLWRYSIGGAVSMLQPTDGALQIGSANMQPAALYSLTSLSVRLPGSRNAH